MVGGVGGPDRDDWDVELATDHLGDGAGWDALFGDAVDDGTGWRLVECQPHQAGPKRSAKASADSHSTGPCELTRSTRQPEPAMPRNSLLTAPCLYIVIPTM